MYDTFQDRVQDVPKQTHLFFYMKSSNIVLISNENSCDMLFHTPFGGAVLTADQLRVSRKDEDLE